MQTRGGKEVDLEVMGSPAVVPTPTPPADWLSMGLRFGPVGIREMRDGEKKNSTKVSRVIRKRRRLM